MMEPADEDRRRPRTVAQAEAAYFAEVEPFLAGERDARRAETLRRPMGFRNADWEALKAAMRPGDELWEFTSARSSWDQSRAGPGTSWCGTAGSCGRSPRTGAEARARAADAAIFPPAGEPPPPPPPRHGGLGLPPGRGRRGAPSARHAQRVLAFVFRRNSAAAAGLGG
jgi:hypothetical protein